MKVLDTLISVIFLLFTMVLCDLKIEVMKEGLLDLKTTILRSPNVTEFSGSASEPYIGGTAGELIPFSPIDGCSELIESAPFTKRDEKTNLLRFSTVNGKSEQVIVLISRGGCNFNDKFKNAKKVKGVVGVLIYNGPDDSIPTDKIPLTNQSDDVPGYLISNSLGIEIFKKILKYRTQSSPSLNDTNSDSNSIPYLEVTMTPISIDSTNKANTMIQIALIAIIIILALSFAASILVHMRTSQFSQTTNSPNNNNNNGANNNADNNSHVPIDVEFLQKLPLKTFKGRRGSSEIQNTNNNNISNSNGERSNNNNNNNNNNSDNGAINTNNHAIMYSGIKSPNYSSKSNSDSIDEKLTSPKVRDNLNLQFTNDYFAMIQHEWPMNDSCPICLDEFNQNEVLNELPCGHCYHIACIQPWLQYRSPVCPLCKLDVREEFKADLNKTTIGNAVKPEEITRSKLKNIWDKLILKSRPLNDAQARTRIINNANTVPDTDIINTSNTNDQVFITPSTTIHIPQIPQRALTQDSSSSSTSNNLNSFHNIPL